MADVLIKGMEMPKSCGDCPFLYDHDACYESGMWHDMRFMLLCLNGHTNEYRLGEFPFKEKRVDWCPLVEVPKHGRLIDADLLEIAFLQIKRDYTGDIVYALDIDRTLQMINYSPTVIEASEDGEQDGKL